jgi:hypothetical protein
LENQPSLLNRNPKASVIIADRIRSPALGRYAARRVRAYLWSKSTAAIIGRLELA